MRSKAERLPGAKTPTQSVLKICAGIALRRRRRCVDLTKEWLKGQQETPCTAGQEQQARVRHLLRGVHCPSKSPSALQSVKEHPTTSSSSPSPPVS
mgnify:CR=1 FL=1